MLSALFTVWVPPLFWLWLAGGAKVYASHVSPLRALASTMLEATFTSVFDIVSLQCSAGEMCDLARSAGLLGSHYCLRVRKCSRKIVRMITQKVY